MRSDKGLITRNNLRELVLKKKNKTEKHGDVTCLYEIQALLKT